MIDVIYVDRAHHGQGVFAARHIKAGEKILQFSGRPLSFEEAIAKGSVHQADPIQVGHRDDPAAYFDTQEPGRSINHSCRPNAGIINDNELTALCDINVDEEITYDYSTTMDEDYWTMVCRCGHPQCRGVIKDFKYLDPETRQRYLDWRSVQGFIAAKYTN